MTIDEELDMLEQSVRRLKIEYDVYFGGGSKKPPTDTEWRVQNLVKKYSDSGKLNYAQRFRYNTVVQRFALFSDLWRQKLKIKEEGYRRPQDAALGIVGMRTEEEHKAAEALEVDNGAGQYSVVYSDVAADPEHVRALFDAMVEARRKVGDAAAANANFASFENFVKTKNEQIRREFGCESVEYSVEIDHGQVRLKAKAKA